MDFPRTAQRDKKAGSTFGQTSSQNAIVLPFAAIDLTIGDNMTREPATTNCSTSDNRFIDLHDCAVSGEIPSGIRSLIGRCEVLDRIDNDDLSLALKFGELLWRRLLRMAEHYEKQSGNFMPGDSRADMMAQAARDMRFVLSDCVRDL